MKRNWLEATLHTLFWLGSAWLITSGFSIQSQEIELIDGQEIVHTVRSEPLMIKLLLCIAWSMVMSYVNVWNLLRLNRPGSRTMVALTSIGILVIAIVAFPLLASMVPGHLPIGLPPTLQIGILVWFFTISTAYGLIRAWSYTEKQQQQLIYAKQQAELSLLRNQLQPHFLFNALNNLLSMVDQQKSPALVSAFGRLSDLLRYIIDDSRSGMVTISEEIEFIRNYVALQLLRFEPGEVDFQLETTGPYNGQKIEPGLLLPFVENAFKYGAAPDSSSVIRLQIDVARPDRMIFHISNPVVQQIQEIDRSGLGLQSTRQRLNLLYPHRHTLDIQSGDPFIVHLQLQSL
ncbi:MAG: histidine kinase [Saprospiraceae bacterium]|nr:histidine kinase [Saprospiraceae bacterium]